MATKRSTSKSARTSGKSAGKPVVVSVSRARKTAKSPSKEELDVRDRLKAGPRRPAGPPLVGDVMTRAAIEALRNEVVPQPTDPRKRGGKRK